MGFEATATPSAGEGVIGIVLAAGASRRFGSPKQLAPLAGRPLLEHALAAAAAAGSLDGFVVVLGAHAEAILAGVELHGAEPVIAADWAEGQAASLRAGVAAVAARAQAVVITLGDQPGIDPRAIDRVVAGREPASLAVRATYGRRPGHPVLLERALFDRVGGLRGDAGARGLLEGAAVVAVPCEDVGSDHDVDTVAQLGLSGGESTRAS